MKTGPFVLLLVTLYCWAPQELEDKGTISFDYCFQRDGSQILKTFLGFKNWQSLGELHLKGAHKKIYS